jgi:hypothetical protein
MSGDHYQCKIFHCDISLQLYPDPDPGEKNQLGSLIWKPDVKQNKNLWCGSNNWTISQHSVFCDAQYVKNYAKHHKMAQPTTY